MKKIVLDNAELYLYDEINNIILFKFLSTTDYTLEDAKKIDEAYLELCQKKPFLSIADVREVFATSTPEAKDYIAHKALLTKYRIASAWVVTNLASKLIVQTYIKMHKPNCPTKVFKNLDEAKKWLLTFKEKD